MRIAVPVRIAIVLALAVGLGAAGCSDDGEGDEPPLPRMNDASMEPTIHCAKPAQGCSADEGDRLRPVSDASLERGDVIAFRIPPRARACASEPNAVFVSRLIGFPGETWAERDGFIYIDGRRLAEPYVEASRRSELESIPSHKIPARTYVVLGDNRSQSCDSRRWGALPARNVMARVVAVERGDETIALD